MISETMSSDSSIGDAKNKFHFRFLPAYAEYLLQHELRPFTMESLNYSRELQLPILRFFEDFTDEQLIEMGLVTTRKLLTALAHNKAQEFIDESIKEWLSFQSPLLSKDQVELKDITLVSFIRRRTFRKFLNNFTDRFEHFGDIMFEVDLFTSEQEFSSIKNLIDIQQGLYKEAQTLSQLGNWVLDVKSGRINWSEQVYRIYDIDPSTQLKLGETDFASFNHPEDSRMIREKIRETIETLAPHDFYYRITTRNGIHKILHAIGEVQTNEKGEVVRLIGTLQDVTLQKTNEKNLLEKQHFIQKIADITPSLIAVYNIHSGKYIFVNQAIKPLLGYEIEEWQEKGLEFVMQLVHPEDLISLVQENEKALEVANASVSEKEPILEFQYRLRHKNGQYRMFRTYGTVFTRNKDGRIEDLINISLDVTEQFQTMKELQKKEEQRKSAEEQLKEYASNLKDANSSLVRSNRELQQFAYAASHDLQEPLRKITIFSDKLQQQFKDDLPDTGKEYISKLVSSTKRMSRLIEDLLNFSRVSRSEDQFSDTDLNEILKSILMDYEVLINQKNAKVTYDKLPAIQAIPLQMSQLIQNLVSNSLKFSNEHVPPEVNISSKNISGKNLLQHPQLNPKSEYIEIIIKDNGIGFNETYKEQIFTIFQRLHGKSEYAGTGIGLALCRKITDSHNGLIFAKSEEKKGSEFHVILPVKQNF
jgi:signal transduction histidine kinase